MRITNGMMVNNVLYNVHNSLSKMDKFSNQLSTGKRFVLAEDDPINTVLGMHFRTKITESEQFIRNIDDGISWLDTCDQALGHATELFRRVRTVTLQGINDTLDQSDRDALAKEIDQLLLGILDTANTEFKGDFIFAGTNTTGAPFEISYGKDPGQSSNVTTHDYRNPENSDRMNINFNSVTGVKYNGNSSTIYRQLQQSLSVEINDTGNYIFGAEKHRITSGSLNIRSQTLPLNNALNFNGELDTPPPPPPALPQVGDGPTSFTVGINGGQMATISYNADTDSILDVADKINEKAVGLKAIVEKVNIDNEDFFQLVFEANEPGTEIIMFDSDKAGRKTTSEPTLMAMGGFNPDVDGFGHPDFPDTPTGEVIINGKQFILNDYTTVRQFMNAVVNDPDTGISEFNYNSATGVFEIKSEHGKAIDIIEKGDINTPGNMGFFSGLGINTNGNFLEKMNMTNKIFGNTSLGSRNETLSNVNNISSGSFVVNGAVIQVDVQADSLESVAKKINQADVGVYATVEEDTDGAGNFRLVLRSQSPGEIKLEDREGDILQGLGFINNYNGQYYNYPKNIDNPRDIGVFSVIMEIRDNLYKGDNLALEKNLGKIDVLTDNILQYRSKIGARVHAAEISQSKLDDVRINTITMLSNVEDVDIAEVIMKMLMQQNVQDAALKTGAGIIQRTLMDFLR